MQENSLELAENKLILLYIVKNIKYPVTKTQLTDLVLETSFINYFTLQQYIDDLDTSGFIEYQYINEKHYIQLTDKGDNVLTFFGDRISKSKIAILDSYIVEKRESIKKELTIHSDYTPDDNNSFIVTLKALENNSLLIDLKLSVGSKKQAIDLCSKWKENSSEIYTKIINSLIQ
ncbi:DUF4364 family protein [Clostridium intestinale]|jgi:predicted transcriptional regulator|uniref:DUF4364 family protein n=1 Tax=Clostridium intestinale TaxID=36845 RepID=UPI0028E46D98|nr:DUF4364 family protein [Clostridium intestinale]WRY53469.1 DUF4364 family protein [Clostridium intestinale]